jgi:hypothetical protein
MYTKILGGKKREEDGFLNLQDMGFAHMPPEVALEV